MNANLTDTIAELDRISALVDRYRRISHEIDALKEQNDTDLRNLYRECYPSLPKGPEVFQTLEPEVGAFESPSARGIKIGLIGTVASIIVWIIAGLINPFGITGYAFMATVIFAIWFVVSYRKYAADKKEYDAKVARRTKFKDIIENSHSADIARFQTDLNEYYNLYQAFDQKWTACCETYVQQHNRMVEDYAAVEQEIGEVTLLSGEHVALAKRIADALKSGRADSLKEGLNLVIAEQRDEEFKAQQLAEESRRTQIAEQQAYENRMHNQRMEREAAAQAQYAQAQAQIAQQQLKATEQQNRQLQQILNNQRR